MEVKNYTELIVWQKSMSLAKEVHRLIEKLPKKETYALADQLNRASTSVPSNIAEGNGRVSKKEYIRFLSIARGSKSEVETQLLLCIEFGYFQRSEADKALGLCTEIGKMLNVMISKLRG